MHMYVKRKEVGIKSGNKIWKMTFINEETEAVNSKFQGSVIYGKLYLSI